MAIMWQLIIPAITQILDKVIPDPQAAAEAKLKAISMAQAGELAELSAMKELALGQLEVNKAEAESNDPFRSGWRPLIGYVIGGALAFQYIINPLIVWGAALWAPDVTPPVIAMDDHLWELVLGMLGLAGWRTMDKIKGKG